MHTMEVPMWSEADLYWLAGLLEGEGAFTAGPSARPNAPRITLGMTDIDVIRRAADLMGITSIHTTHRNPKWQPMYHLSLKGKRAVEVMRTLYPLMGSRRQAQIDRALANYAPDRHSRGRSRLSDEQVLEIYRRAHNRESLRCIAADMGVSYNACSDIKCGQSWTWLTGHVRDQGVRNNDSAA